MHTRKASIYLGLWIILFTLPSTWAQNHAPTSIVLQQDTSRRPITTAVPFLAIAPDARSAGLGEAGVAISSDANAIYWNPAKLVFAETPFEISFSYAPWLRNLVDDMFLSFLSAYYQLDDKQAVGISLRYFSLGDVEFTNMSGNIIGNFHPREFASTLTYSRQLGRNVGLAISGRFIYSNITGNLTLANQQSSKAGITGAADMAFYYRKNNLKIAGRPSHLSFGVNISNLGAKISYSNRNEQDFIPTNLRFGSALMTKLDPLERNSIMFTVDFNKLMVPTPSRIDNSGTDPSDQTVLSGVFGSFADAPNGFREELQEITTSMGVEYIYHNYEGEDIFAARVGYFNEHENKGNRKYFTVGVGLSYRLVGFDMAYLIPQNQAANNPLAETLRFTLSLGADSFKKVEDEVQ